MDAKRKKELIAKGWKVGSTRDFLNISDEEMALIELKISLGTTLQHTRKQKKMTQSQLAKILHSSQSRVAKMETGDPSVSLDLLVKSLFSLGLSKNELAKVIA
jgi:DNA-binding XRE family transcriptional regulator